MTKAWAWEHGDAIEKLPKALRKYAAIIDDLHTEDDGCFQNAAGRSVPGIWCYLIEGLQCLDMGCGSVHESSIARVADALDRGIAWSEEIETLIEALLTVDPISLAVAGDAIEEGRAVCAWEDGGAAPTSYRVGYVASWQRDTTPQFRYVKAYSPEGAVKMARLCETDTLSRVEVFDK